MKGILTLYNKVHAYTVVAGDSLYFLRLPRYEHNLLTLSFWSREMN